MVVIVVVVVSLEGVMAGLIGIREEEQQGNAGLTGPVLVTEVLYDPDPAIALPGFEFAEWHNYSSDTLNLKGWKWVVGDRVGEAKEVVVASNIKWLPGEYVIVCSKTAAPAFEQYGRVLSLDPFPALRNSGDRLTLLDPTGRISHTLVYSPDLYPDMLKRNGGWSLELSDLRSPCADRSWVPSVDPSGGTPGRSNSVQGLMPESAVVKMLRAGVLDDERLFCLFSGSLAWDPSVHDYSARLQPGDIDPEPVASPWYGFPGLFFTLPASLDDQRIYTLDISGSVVACTGESSVLRPVSFAVPARPDSGCIVINEVMFDPGAGRPEWIELYNRGSHTVDLQTLIIARANTDNSIVSFSDTQELSFLLFPGMYAVVTSCMEMMISAYPHLDPALSAERTDLPALPAGESQLILMDLSQQVIDRIRYHPDWHYPYLNETTSVSLERIDPNSSGITRENWFSASQTSSRSLSGACTPASPNSVLSSQPPDSLQPSWSFTPATSLIIPGEPIVLHYSFAEPGWFCSLSVFNNRGQLVRQVSDFSLAGLQGVLSWDGLDGQGQLVPEGIYLLVVRCRHPTGRMGRWKGAFAVSDAVR